MRLPISILSVSIVSVLLPLFLLLSAMSSVFAASRDTCAMDNNGQAMVQNPRDKSITIRQPIQKFFITTSVIEELHLGPGVHPEFVSTLPASTTHVIKKFTLYDGKIADVCAMFGSWQRADFLCKIQQLYIINNNTDSIETGNIEKNTPHFIRVSIDNTAHNKRVTFHVPGMQHALSYCVVPTAVSQLWRITKTCLKAVSIGLCPLLTATRLSSYVHCVTSPLTCKVLAAGVALVSAGTIIKNMAQAYPAYRSRKNGANQPICCRLLPDNSRATKSESYIQQFDDSCAKAMR